MVLVGCHNRTQREPGSLYGCRVSGSFCGAAGMEESWFLESPTTRSDPCVCVVFRVFGVPY